MKESLVAKKSYLFSIEIVKYCYFLSREKREYVLSKQLIRSGTSIGANVEEALGGQSRKDFVAKMSLSYKEALETNYWLRLIRDSKIVSEKNNETLNLLNISEELIKILSAIIRTSKKSL
ncbi:four helix bundle protein [Patescibacteria group bacterium]|nr:four helix bundle protein [Patescibacteria group bacterium]